MEYTGSQQDLKYIVSNYTTLAENGALEEKLISAYLHAKNFKDIPFETLKMLFDACSKEKLHSLHPLPKRDVSISRNPISLFRGCVGETFREGMSWTTCLYQAIRYPTRAKEFNFYGDCIDQPCSVYATIVEAEEIYCYLNHYEPEFIVCPKRYWKIDVPQDVFSYDTKHSSKIV